MTPEQFCTWLQGYVEISNSYPTEDEWEVIITKLSTTKLRSTSDFTTRLADTWNPKKWEGNLCV